MTGFLLFRGRARIIFRDVFFAVMGDAALDVIEIVPMVRFYDYEAKYAAGGSASPVAGSSFTKCLPTGPQTGAGGASGTRMPGMSRADFRYDDGAVGTGPVCLEVDTQPGMTETSLVSEIAAHAGISIGELVRWMVEDASLNC